MRVGYSPVHRMTAAEFASGVGSTVVGGFIEIVDANGQSTGVMYLVGPAGTVPTPIVSGEYRLAGEAIDSFNVVYDVDGTTCRLASSNSPSTVEQVLGLSMNAATAGQIVQILRSGVYQGYTGFSGGLLFLGLNGVVAHAPATSGVSLQVGNAINDHLSDFDIKTPVYL
jgi:hypothetical protein